MAHGGSRKGSGRPKKGDSKIEQILEGQYENLEKENQKTQAPEIDETKLGIFIYNKLLELSKEGDVKALSILLDRYENRAPTKARTKYSANEQQEMKGIFSQYNADLLTASTAEAILISKGLPVPRAIIKDIDNESELAKVKLGSSKVDLLEKLEHRNLTKEQYSIAFNDLFNSKDD